MLPCSIVVPCYNTAQYLPECLNSLLGLDYSDYEILLVDDGSSDSTPQVVDTFLRKSDRITCIHQSHKGVQYALEVGIQHCKYPVVTIVDSDDRVFPCALRAVMPCFDDPDLGVAWSRFVTSNNKPGWSGPCPGDSLYAALMSNWWRAAHHKFFRRSVYAMTPGLQPQFDRSVDFELMLLLASTGCKYKHVDTVTYWYRQGRVGSITSQGAAKQRETVKEIREWIQQQSFPSKSNATPAKSSSGQT